MGHMNWRTGTLIALALVVAGLLIGWQLTPRVEQALPENDEIQGRQSLTLQFNNMMDAQSVEAILEIVPPLDGEINWDEDQKLMTFTPFTIWPSGETVSIQLGRGARSRLRLPILQEFTRQWRIRPTSLVYLWPADGTSNLYQANPENGQSWALTEHSRSVLDYSISPDQEQIFYTLAGDQAGSAIMAIDLQSGLASQIIVCREMLCTSPQLSPDGNRLAYQVIPQLPGTQPGIRILDLRDGSELDLGQPEQHLDSPLWSPSGWLAYYNHTTLGFQFWNFLTEEIRFLPNETSGDGTWSEDGRYFLASEIIFAGETLAPRHLQLYDLVEETIQDLSRGSFLEDLNPSFANQGLVFAFSRKSLAPQEWTPGRQLWIMDLNSGETTAYTDEVDYHHTSFAWHPDGRRLAYVRYNQATLSEAPEIWLLDTASGESLRLIINGFAPGWIP